jgi:hypothetical protein
MAKIPEFYDIGSNEDLSLEKLLDIMMDMYRDLAIQLNKKPDVYERTTDGLSSDTFLSNGDININTTTGNVQTLVGRPTASTVEWSGSGGTGDISAFAVTNNAGVLLNGNNLTSAQISATRYKFTFTTPMSNINYAVIVSGEFNGVASRYSFNVESKTVNDFVINKSLIGGVITPLTSLSVVVIT